MFQFSLRGMPSFIPYSNNNVHLMIKVKFSLRGMPSFIPYCNNNVHLMIKVKVHKEKGDQ